MHGVNENTGTKVLYSAYLIQICDNPYLVKCKKLSYFLDNFSLALIWLTLQLLPTIWLEYLNLDCCIYPTQEDSVIELDFGKGEHLINLNCKSSLASKLSRIGDLSDFDTVNEYNEVCCWYVKFWFLWGERGEQGQKGKNGDSRSLNHSVKLGPAKKLR